MGLPGSVGSSGHGQEWNLGGQDLQEPLRVPWGRCALSAKEDPQVPWLDSPATFVPDPPGRLQRFLGRLPTWQDLFQNKFYVGDPPQTPLLIMHGGEGLLDKDTPAWMDGCQPGFLGSAQRFSQNLP